MTALAARRGSRPAVRPAVVARPFAVTVALAAVVATRWAAWRSGVLDPVAVGAAFGGTLLALGLAAGWRVPRRWDPRDAGVALALGAGAGGVLALTALIGPHPAWSAVYAVPFPLGPWAAATVLVAVAEEVVLRGALWAGLEPLLGVGATLVATSVAFALMHVPVYGWQAVPLDLGVGLVLGGLRLVSGGVAAPAVAHAVADLAVLWL